MALTLTHPDAEELVRTLARLDGVAAEDAVLIALREALARRQRLEAAAQIRKAHGITLDETSRTPLPRSVFDAMWS